MAHPYRQSASTRCVISMLVGAPGCGLSPRPRVWFGSEVLLPTPWMGLAPDDAPLILRSHDTEELYALDWEAP